MFSTGIPHKDWIAFEAMVSLLCRSFVRTTQPWKNILLKRFTKMHRNMKWENSFKNFLTLNHAQILKDILRITVNMLIKDNKLVKEIVKIPKNMSERFYFFLKTYISIDICFRHKKYYWIFWNVKRCFKIFYAKITTLYICD